VKTNIHVLYGLALDTGRYSALYSNIYNRRIEQPVLTLDEAEWSGRIGEENISFAHWDSILCQYSLPSHFAD
jgi:hypothetical protein